MTEEKRINVSEEQHKIFDLEPKWVEIVRFWKNSNAKVSDDCVFPELVKMAKACDTLRLKQKKGIKGD